MLQDLEETNSSTFDLSKVDRMKTVIFGIFFVGLFLLAIGGGLLLFKGQNADDDIRIIGADDKSDELSNKIIVHIDGAVNKPGIYELNSDSRVNNAVDAAGGLAGGVDMDRVNLAAKLADGQKVYLPRIGEKSQDVQGVSFEGGQPQSGLININSAAEAQLDTLPGVGPVTAGKIIAGRPYSSLEELLVKKAVGVGNATFEKIKEMITVY